MMVIRVFLIDVTSQNSKCRPSIYFYHIPHGAISGWIDQPVLNGLYKFTYMIRSHVTRIQNKPTVVISSGTEVLYLIQSECYGASPKSGPSITLIDGKSNMTQVITYPMGYNGIHITFLSPRREPFIIECVDTSLFAFDISMKRSKQVLARIRNIKIPPSLGANISDTFTLEVAERYRDLTAFFIAASLIVDEYMYPASVDQKRKYCN